MSLAVDKKRRGPRKAYKFNPERMAQGALKPNGAREYGIPFGDDDADEIRAFAIKQQVTFAEAVRTLVTWGLESVAPNDD